MIERERRLDLRNRQKSAWMRMPHPHCGWLHPHSYLKQWKSTQKPPAVRVGHPHWGLSQISETANSQRNNVQCGCTHPQCGSVTRTGDLEKFQKMKVYTEKPPSAAAPIRSAGRPPALGLEITIQKKSEASADALDSNACRPPALRFTSADASPAVRVNSSAVRT